MERTKLLCFRMTIILVDEKLSKTLFGRFHIPVSYYKSLQGEMRFDRDISRLRNLEYYLCRYLKGVGQSPNSPQGPTAPDYFLHNSLLTLFTSKMWENLLTCTKVQGQFSKPMSHDLIPIPKPPKDWTIDETELSSSSPDEEPGPSYSKTDPGFSEPNIPHLISQSELNDQVRDLNLSKVQAELLGSRLQEWHLLLKGVKSVISETTAITNTVFCC
ncbi:hypothetical protein C0J52_17279 [Blattella germanica]|nr:hypothetical protein C0J52_17279 [Blattella germanica]